MQSVLADRRSFTSGTKLGAMRHGWLVLSAFVLIATLFLQQRWWPITDVSWLITVCEKMLAGERLYIDVIETNPPFSVWLYMPPVAAAQWSPFSSEALVLAWVILLVGIGMTLSAAVAVTGGLLSGHQLKTWLPGTLVMLLLWPANAFGEREHIAAALFLPMIVLAAWRASAEARSGASVLLAIGVGLSGSVLLLVKPYYAVIPLVMSLYLAGRRRDPRFLFTVENITIGLVCCAYLGAVWLLHPEFLKTIYPLLEDTYLQHTWPTLVLQLYLPGFLVLGLLLRLLYAGTSVPRLLEILLIAAAAACLPFVYQGKGWSYHAYPAIAFAGMALLLVLLTATRPPSSQMKQRFLLGMLLVGAMLNWRPFYPTEKPGSPLLAGIEASIPEARRVAVFGTDIATGNIINRLVDGEWIERYCSDWLGGMALWLADAASQRGDVSAEAKYRRMAATYSEEKLQRLVEAKPNLLLIQRSDPVWEPYWRADARFQTFLQAYRQIAEDDRVVAYGLRD